MEIDLQIEGRSKEIALTGPGPWILGRAESSDIPFPDDQNCSRKQAVIRRSGEEFLLEPISSVAPIKVNDRVIGTPQIVMDGDVVRFARQTLRIHIRHSRGSRQGAAREGRPAHQDRGIREPVVVRNNLIIMRQDASGSQRSGGAALYLDHPNVSRRHARFIVNDRGTSIEDLGSTNGTRINGKRISSRTLLARGDEVAIGIFSLTFDGTAVTVRAHAEGAILEANSISKILQKKGIGTPLVLLDDVTLEINPGEFVCIIGASGSGKSTLMNVISGRKRPTEGIVHLGEFDIHANFDTLKQDIAYVPQNDMLHGFLTLRQALDYVARLRLPRDLSPEARTQIVYEAVVSVGLEHRLNVKIESLSGGQKKRASLATEVLSRPNLLFLDEVTSGLDESTDREIMTLLKRLTQRGMTIVCVTHTLANIEEFSDSVIIMGEGGSLAFYGHPQDVATFFGTRKLSDVFETIDKSGVAAWRNKFQSMARSARLQRKRMPTDVASREQNGSFSDWLHLLSHQLSVLTGRNIALLLGDTRTLMIAAIQSGVVGVFLGYAYRNFGRGGLEISNSKLSFLLVYGITCLWIGCSGTAKEIVGELPIFLREHDINLSTIAFVVSKFLVTSIFVVMQIALLTLVCGLVAQEIPGGGVDQFLLAALAAVSGVGLGLVISSISNSRDQAAVLVPLALAPQLIFGSGLVTDLSGFGQWITKLVVGAYWAREAMTAMLVSSENIITFNPATMQLISATAEGLGVSVRALAIQTLGWLGLSIGVMYFRYARKSE